MPKRVKQCWKIMVATQNIDTLGPIWTFSLRSVLTFVAVCWVILRGQQMYTVIQAVHSLLYIVAKWHFFSVVTWKYIIKYLQKCEGCTHFCEILCVSVSVCIHIYKLIKYINKNYNTIPMIRQHCNTEYICKWILQHLLIFFNIFFDIFKYIDIF